jgi:hypothetical protein
MRKRLASDSRPISGLYSISCVAPVAANCMGVYGEGSSSGSMSRS